MVNGLGNHIELTGSLTMDTAAAYLRAGLVAIENAPASVGIVVDFAHMDNLDSSALTVVFAWMRTAQEMHKSFVLSNPSPELLSLAAMYGVDDLLPLA